MRVSIIGAGYVGLVTGVSVARGGHHVTFVERSATRRQALRDGRVPIFEPGLQKGFDSAHDSIVVVEKLEASPAPDLVLVAVGTPIGDGGTPDESQLVAALEELRRYPTLDTSIRSTLAPGRSVTLPRLLGRADGRRISTNPEFLRQGTAMDDFARPSRVVIGKFPETETAHVHKVESLHAGVTAPLLLVDVSAAELIKNVANAFLALKLSFVNEVASLSEEYGVDVEQVLTGIGLDPRIGTAYMRPGLGFGGSCLPKELDVLSDAGRRRGLAMHIARAASQVNVEQQDRFARRLLSQLGTPPARVGMLGLSFKAHTDDLRGSPAIRVIHHLLTAGHQVVAYDPAVAPEQAVAALPGLDIAACAEDVFEAADAVAVATEWPEFASLDLAALRPRMRRPVLFDGRNLFQPAAVIAAGLSYRGIGRPDVDPPAAAEPAQPADEADATAWSVATTAAGDGPSAG